MRKSLLLLLLILGTLISVPRSALSSGDTQYRTRDRIVFSKTALNPDAGELSVTGYDAYFWDINYSVNDSITLGSYINIPAIIGAAIPHISYTVKVSNSFALGAGFFTGVLGQYAQIGTLNRWFMWLGGGYFAATCCMRSHIINLNVTFLSAGTLSSSHSFRFYDAFIVVPNIAYRFIINDMWSLLFEVHSINGIKMYHGHGEFDYRDNGKIWALVYGCRVSGEQVYGDFGFVFPITEKYMNDTWKYVPIGIPYIAVGKKF